MKIAAALLTSALLLAGCSGEDSDGPAPEPSSGSAQKPAGDAQPEQSEETVVEVVIKGGKAVPQGKRVEVGAGERVRLDVRSDADEEIHVHSDPEHTYEVPAGGRISEAFSIKTPGQVAVEAHHLGVTIVQLVVRP